MLLSVHRAGLSSQIKFLRGFSLIEVMVIVAIVAILAAIAAPTFGEYTTNTRVRAAAEALQSDLVLARNEALKRNQPVTLIYNLAATPPLSLIQTTDPGVGVPTDVRRRDLTEESFLSLVDAGGTSTSVTATFDSLGRLTTPPIRVTMSKPSKGVCVPLGGAGGKVRCMRVDIASIGAARMCDPVFNYAANTRGCVP